MAIKETYEAMQKAFKQGLITYPRSNDKAISEESIACIHKTAKIFGFDLGSPTFQPLNKTNIHQAPSITPKGVEVLKNNNDSSIDDTVFYVLKMIALLQLRSGVLKQVKKIETEQIKLPDEFAWMKELTWERWQYDNAYINKISGLSDSYKSSVYTPYDEDKAIIKTMQKVKLGTPATQVKNTQRFINLKLYNHKKLKLTQKGDKFFEKIEGRHNSKSVNTSDALLNKQGQDFAVVKSIDTIIGTNNREKQMAL